MKQYSGDYLQEIVFPLSGIGTGGVGISGIGQLVDWELDGRANKNSVNEYSHFAIKAERDGRVLDARVLHGDRTLGLNGTALASHHHSWGYGHGPNRTTLAGIAHFPDVTFTGEFPFAELDYSCDRMPAEVHLSAMNPFFPNDEDNSSLPAAFFSFRLKNTSEETTDYTVAFSVGNPFRISEGGYSSVSKDSGRTSITLKNRNLTKDKTEYGELSITTDCESCSYQEYWYRSGWFDELTTFWREFSAFGPMKNRHYDDDDRHGQLDVGDMATLAAKITLGPGEIGHIRFLMTWYYPHFVMYWDDRRPTWDHEYVRRFSSSLSVGRYCFENWDRLFGKSREFADALSSVTAPEAVAESAADTLCVLKSATCLLLSDGKFWAFEGTNANSGSCEGTCDHVWLYQYALPLLFPRLARGILEISYTYDLLDSGEMKFRTMLPLGNDEWEFRACVDGQMGCVIRFYREWKLSGDTDWLKKWWKSVKKSIEYAWSPENKDLWDPGKTGVITGRQHHTLDVELFGPNSWLTGYYLAALKAGAEMAEAVGEPDTAAEYRRIFARGREYVDSELFNGRHYIQKIDIKDISVLEPFKKYDPDIMFYWNDEKKELKYQFAGGSEIDQMVAQWHASIIGLGDIFDPEHRRIAAQALYDLNFRSMRDVFNPCRIFAVNDESGAVICNWGEGEYKPQIPIPYTEECMTGFEYAAAGLLIGEGLIDEGFEIVDAIRYRYDGKKRNPFSEIECGASYARSMASFALLPILSGMSFDMTRGMLGFDPKISRENFSSVWFTAQAWGRVEITREQCVLYVLDGSLELREFVLSGITAVKSVDTDGVPVRYRAEGGSIRFDDTVTCSCELRVKY